MHLAKRLYNNCENRKIWEKHFGMHKKRVSSKCNAREKLKFAMREIAKTAGATV